MDSVVGIQKVLQLFYSFSGLQLNCAKTEMYSSGFKKEILEVIQQRTGFRIGHLPVRYLGVPPVTRRLTDSDCAPLVEKITARINHWAAKFLSYTGRYQLIQSVLFSLNNYWCKNFILPTGVIRKINKLCSSFFC